MLAAFIEVGQVCLGFIAFAAGVVALYFAGVR